jgi:hypothetical protein
MLPIDTTIAKFPVGAFAGICRFTCKTPGDYAWRFSRELNGRGLAG